MSGDWGVDELAGVELMLGPRDSCGTPLFFIESSQAEPPKQVSASVTEIELSQAEPPEQPFF